MKPNVLRNSSLRGVLFLLLCIVGMGNVWGEKYKLITSTDELVAGCRYIIASMTDGSGAVMKNYVFDANNWGQIETNATNSYITYQSGMARLTLGGSSESWTFHNGSYYLDATSTTSSNHLKGSTDIDKYNKFSISFSNKAATIKCKGKDKKDKLLYNSTSKIFSCYDGNQKAVYLYKEVPVSSISISGTPTHANYYVGDTPSAEGLVVTATYCDNSTEDVTASTTWTFEPETIAKDTKSVKATAVYQGISVYYTYDISSSSIANTESTPYSVVEACTYINNGKGLIEEVYIKATVSKVDCYDETSGSITYWISDDGTTIGQQFMCDSGLDIEKAKFYSINDLKLGTIITVKGIMKKDGNIYKFATNNTIISKDESTARTLSAIEINGQASKISYYVGDKPSAEGLSVIAIYSDGSYADVTQNAEWNFTPETIAKETTLVTATAKYQGQEDNYSFNITSTQAYMFTLDLRSKTYYAATTKSVDWEANIVQLHVDKAESSTNANNYLGGDENQRTSTRFYKNSNVIISPTANIAKIVFRATSENYAKALANSTFVNATTNSNNTDVTIIPIEGHKNIKITIGEVCGFTGIDTYYFPSNILISPAGYATFCLPYNATIPEGLTAYTATDNGESVKLHTKEGGKIAAGEGVVLEGDEGTYTFVAAEGSVKTTAGNQMVGVTKDTKLTGADNAYMLTRKKEDGSIAFRLLKTDYTLGANKAYLKASNTTNSRELIPALWDDSTTGIDDIAGNEKSPTCTIYNLSGQKLTRTQKGINIINGKLVIK